MTKLYPSTLCNAHALTFVKEAVPSFAGSNAPLEHIGFHLIKETLVPYSFILDLEAEIMHARLNCFTVTSVTDLISTKFLESLSPLQRSVLGECVMVMIEEGNIPFSLTLPKEAA